jgi:hypothetical protein
MEPMTADITARLEYGKQRLNLNDDHYALDDDFVPVGRNAIFDVNSGSSANRTGGGELSGVKYEDREWSFGIQVRGASLSEIETNLRRLTRFLSQYDGRDPLYLAYKGDSLPEPIYGLMGACSRYRIITATWGKIGGYYQIKDTRKRYTVLPVRLRVAPAKHGPRTLLATAKGTVMPDLLGSPDGLPRGWRSLPTLTNWVTNPIFGNASYLTGWTVGSNLIAYKNTDRAFVYPGSPASVCVVATALTNNTVQTSVTASVGMVENARITFVLKAADGGEIDATDAELNFGGASVTTTFIPAEDGFWMLHGDIVFTDTPTVVAVRLKNLGRGFYVCAAAVSIKNEPNNIFPIIHGDGLGCSWSGTPHASVSASAAGLLSLPITPSTLTLGSGSVFLTIKLEAWSSDWELTEQKILYTSDGGLGLSVCHGLAKEIRLADGYGGGLNYAVAYPFTEGNETIYVVATWGDGGLKVYANANISEGTITYHPHGEATLYLLSDASGSEPSRFPGILMDFATYDHALTAAEAQALIRQAQQAEDSSIPASGLMFLWTKDGGEQGVNCVYGSGSSNGDYQHLVLAGIPGDMPPEMSFYVRPPGTAAASTYWISRASAPYDDYVPTPGQWFYDLSGTATSAADTGGAVQTLSVPVAGATISMTPYRNRLLTGKTHFLGRLSSATAGLKVRPGFRFSASSSVVPGKTKSLTTDSERRLYYLGNISFDLPETIDPDLGDRENLTPLVTFTRAAGTPTGNVLLDYVLLINGPLFAMSVAIHTTGDMILVRDGQAVLLGDTARNILDYADTDGDPFEIVPNAYNYVWWLCGADGAIHALEGLTYFSAIYAAPCWSLL